MVDNGAPFAFNHDFTIEVEMLPLLDVPRLPLPLVFHGPSAYSGFSYALHFYYESPQDRRIMFWISNSQSQVILLQVPYPAPDQMQFHHVAAVYEQGVMKLYIDGQLLGTTHSPIILNQQLTTPLNVGVDSSSGTAFSGNLERVRISNQALAPESFFNRAAINDGIPASWRARYFGSSCPAEACSAIADPDGDGAINYREYLDRTDPLDRNSVIKKPISVDHFLGTVKGDADGDRSVAQFTMPGWIKFDSLGRLWITELTIPGWEEVAGPSRVRLLDRNGVVRTVAGTNYPGFADGKGSAALFRGPHGMVIAKSGDVFIVDRINHRVRRIDTNWNVSTFVGGIRGDRDGQGANAQLHGPQGLAIDEDGILFVADFMNSKVKKVDTKGNVTTFAEIRAPSDVAVDKSGVLFVSSWERSSIYRLTPGGEVSVIAESVPYIERIALGPDDLLYANSPSPTPALYCFTKTGDLLWRVQFDPGPDYLPTSPRDTHVNGTEFLPSGDILFVDTMNHIIRILRRGVEPLVKTSLESTPQGTNLVMSSSLTQGIIRYTVDGSEPTFSSPLYEAPLLWNPALIYQARVFHDLYPVSELAVFYPGGFSTPPVAYRSHPTYYQPGQKMTVTLMVVPSPGAAAYALEEQPPAGWEVSEISGDGIYDASSQKVKFGPFFDAQLRTFTYQVTPPATEMDFRIFLGQISDDSLVRPIIGDHVIQPGIKHPADNKSADWRLSMPEITRYGAAWKKGLSWDLPPNPIPISYVIRAIQLWKGGESYTMDPGITNLPLAWINRATPPGPRTSVGRLAMASTPGAVSELPACFIPGKAIDVVLRITPQAMTQAYAAQEALPEGWTAHDLSHEGFWEGGVIRWGPFFDGVARTLNYKAVPPAGSRATVTFRGVASFDGLDREIGGQRRTSTYTLTLLARPGSGPDVSFQIESGPGALFTVEFSQDLKTWISLGNITNESGSMIYRVPANGSYTQGFYRISELANQ